MGAPALDDRGIDMRDCGCAIMGLRSFAGAADFGRISASVHGARCVGNHSGAPVRAVA